MDLEYEKIKKNKQRAYYEKNRKKIIAQQKARQKTKRERQQKIIDAFKGDGCLICLEKEPCCLHAHHKDPATKEGNISHAWSNGWADEKLIRELAKCVCLCANCHSKVHAGKLEL